MREEGFLPKIFAYCSNYNTPACPESNNIQKDFSSRIVTLEMKEGADYPEAVEIGRTVTVISKKYCQSCSDFLAEKGLNN